MVLAHTFGWKMRIYEKVKRFDPVTGKPVEKWAFKEVRCDFTGEVLDYDEYGPESYCSYQLDYDGHDPCFGSSGDEYDLGEKHDIDMFQFLSAEYHFKSVGGSDDPEDFAEAMMMKEAVANCTKRKSEWFRCFTFDACCRTARTRTAKRLIEEKVITPDQLSADN